MFSDAISSISWRWRPSSPRIAAAISGSACSSPAVKNESGAEAVLALEAEGLIGEISPPPQPVRGIAAGHVWQSKAALAGYHIGGRRPSTCGTWPIFMQDMVGTGFCEFRSRLLQLLCPAQGPLALRAWFFLSWCLDNSRFQTVGQST